MATVPSPSQQPRRPSTAALPQLVYERQPGAAARPFTLRYRRRQPEKTALYAVVRDHLETFLQEGRDATPAGGGHPPFVEHEFRRYLDCAQLARGFARLRCPSCGEERLVAFSCKGRLCPSCWSRRAADLAADLVDRVLPVARYRQWVLTFPWELRYALSTDRAFFSRMLGVFLRTLFAWHRYRGRRLGVPDGQTGSVSFLQRFTASLTLFPHVHALVPDGLLVPAPPGAATFVPLPGPDRDELAGLTARIVRRLSAVARRRLAPDDADDDDAGEVGAEDDEPLVPACTAEALRSPTHPAPRPVEAPAPRPLCIALGGFTLHAARTVEAEDRVGLERLCRYGLRPPFSVERFSLAPDGRIRYELRKTTARGQTEVFFQPTALLRRLSALLPAPNTQMVRYHGLFANRSRWRPLLLRSLAPAARSPAPVVPKPGGTEVPSGGPEPAPPPRRRRTPWAELLRRVLDVDALKCPQCATPMVVLAFLTDARVVARILTHLGLPTAPPPLARARDPFADASIDLDPQEPADEFTDHGRVGVLPFGSGRAPPNVDP